MTITRVRKLVTAAAAYALCQLSYGAAAEQNAAPAAKVFSEDELAALLAPIALYPDTVVAQILMASTYPLEVVEANRWVKANSTLTGEALATAAKKQSWDQSVQGLTALPDVLAKMDEKLDWTQKLGDAFLAQQAEVMAMVQTLRGKAKAAGNLKSDDKLTVREESAPKTPPAPAAGAPAATPSTAPATASNTTTTIIIEPTDPQVVYVPTYSPSYVYGPWGYPAYPPYYFPYPYGYVPGAAMWWGVSVGVRVAFWGGVWNNNCNWGGSSININGDVNINRGNISGGDRNQINGGNRGDIGSGNRNQINGGDAGRGNGNTWQHDPEHRKGVSYRDNSTAQKYNRPTTRDAAGGDAFKGRQSPSAGTRDMGQGAGGARAGTSDIGGSSAARAGTSDMSRGTGTSAGDSSRNSASTSNRSTGSSSRSGSSAFGGTSSGSRASSFSSRGGASRGGGGGRRR